MIALISSFIAIKALSGNSYEILFSGTDLFGKVPVRIDALSAWFILTINFTMITGAVYGFNYMKKYREMKSEITLHCIAFLFVHFCIAWHMFSSEWIYLSAILGINGNFSFYSCNI